MKKIICILLFIVLSLGYVFINEYNENSNEYTETIILDTENIKSYEGSDSDVTVNKDVPEKFRNMKCNSTFRNEFDGNVEYFNLIDNILSGTSYIYYDRKTLIPGVIRTKYTEVYESCENGTQVLNKMIDELAYDYMGVIDIPFRELKEYFKTIVFWSLNKCDIYNECI